MEENVNLSTVLDAVCQEKNISRDVLIDTVEQAVATAAKRVFVDREIEASFDPETGNVNLFQVLYVVENVELSMREISVEQARRSGLEAEVGDELLFQIFYLEEDQKQAEAQAKQYPEIPALQKVNTAFGRIAAQTAKQVIIQRVREAERENLYDRYKDKKGELMTGIVRRFERGSIIVEVDNGRAEAILPSRDQVPRESLRPGDRIVAYVKDVDKSARGPQIILSRTHKGLVEKLFEHEVPEIFEGIVRIEACAREPGARSKIAVSSRDRDVDPVGACVGMRGSRVQAVVQELRGEKIDIVPFDDDPARFVCNAIQPAQVSRVLIDAERHTMELVVPDDKLSLAIGKKGQNVRLASRLTGWRIDIHSQSKIREMERRSRAEMAAIPGVGRDMALQLFELGWRSLRDLAVANIDELAQVVGSGDEAERIIDTANDAASGNIELEVVYDAEEEEDEELEQGGDA
ncbi:transcription termination/antitermination protein NusA [Pseudenhygromyxa sp. WMMC2535]|uniref:transcription termination factor NusA n=1 Tax=Pseudenhygromyxa sp. WMMC2535 TaxID=2712867 RepID=UPI001555E0C3|nr:transcription termination factor NusA [Pseudenhygromyxa sp. WMMC2535]NVB41568.1 transcription termination/antitermination protein NusA [Pseudenhygromyxa sp. WMMC2535]